MSKKKSENANSDLDWGAMASGLGAKLLDDVGEVQQWIDTGNLALNMICSGSPSKGVPVGKIIEIFGDSASGKSLVGSNLLRGCQKINGVPILLDAEHAVSKDFAVAASKVDPKKLIVLEADTLEMAFDKIKAVIKKIRHQWLVPLDKPIVIIYDSIAASPSEREFASVKIAGQELSKTAMKEVGAGPEKPGERAKTCSREFRSLPGLLEKEQVVLCVINQIRQKIGVMYGCFSYHSKVMLADGSFMKIGKIVNNKLKLDVLSMDLKTGKIEPKPIIGWHDNGILEENENFIKIKFKRQFTNTDGFMVCTKNHRLIQKINNNFVETEAQNIKQGDDLIVLQPYYLSDDQWQIVYGSILGDGSIRSRDYGNHEFRVGHGIKQKDYCLFKQQMFSELVASTEDYETRYAFNLKPIYELDILAGYKKRINGQLVYNIPDVVPEKLNELGLAIWYMDDGTFSGDHEYWGLGKSNICCKKFKDKLKMLPFFHKYGLFPKVEDIGFVFDAENTDKLHKLICRFVPDSMSYKLRECYRHLTGFDFKTKPMDYEPQSHKVMFIDYDHKIKIKSRKKFDLTIQDNATYVVGGAVVHNSDETTAGGGRALEFYSSLRLRMRSNKAPKDKKGNIMGVNVNIMNVKSRCCKPYMEAKKVYLFFEQGINPFGGLLELLIQNDRIEGSNGNYKIKEPYCDGQLIKFKASLERNEIPIDVLRQCPKVVDLQSADQIDYYVNLYHDAIDAVDNEIAGEENLENLVE